VGVTAWLLTGIHLKKNSGKYRSAVAPNKS
jgi:hypothetical protein